MHESEKISDSDKFLLHFEKIIVYLHRETARSATR